MYMTAICLRSTETVLFYCCCCCEKKKKRERKRFIRTNTLIFPFVFVILRWLETIPTCLYKWSMSWKNKWKWFFFFSNFFEENVISLFHVNIFLKFNFYIMRWKHFQDWNGHGMFMWCVFPQRKKNSFFRKLLIIMVCYSSMLNPRGRKTIFNFHIEAETNFII